MQQRPDERHAPDSKLVVMQLKGEWQVRGQVCGGMEDMRVRTMTPERSAFCVLNILLSYGLWCIIPPGVAVCYASSRQYYRKGFL